MGYLILLEFQYALNVTIHVKSANLQVKVHAYHVLLDQIEHLMLKKNACVR